jgi:signal transduction histidine kinase
MDADDFGEVLGNLLDNARKWATRVVEIDAMDLGEGSVKLSVSDDGPGIPDGFRGEALERGTASPREDDDRHADSSGLGLSIVSELLAAYGSRLTLDQSPLGGARVTFILNGSMAGAT